MEPDLPAGSSTQYLSTGARYCVTINVLDGADFDFNTVKIATA